MVAKLRMPAGGIGVGNGAATATHANMPHAGGADVATEHAEGQPGVGETVGAAEQAVAMLESDEPEGDDDGGSSLPDDVKKLWNETEPAGPDEGNCCPDCGCAEFTEGENETIAFNCGAVWDMVSARYISPCGTVDDPTLAAPSGHSAEVSLFLRVRQQDQGDEEIYEEIKLSHVGESSVVVRNDLHIPGPLECDLVMVIDGIERVSRVRFDGGVLGASIGENGRVASHYEVLEVVAADLDPVVAEVSNRLDEHFEKQGSANAMPVPHLATEQPSVADHLRYARAQARREWQESCEEAKEKFVAAALAHAELKAATKIAKAEEEDTMEAYAKLMRQDPSENMAMVQPQAAVAIPAALVRSYDGPAEGASDDEASDTTLAAQGDGEATTTITNTSEAWRAVPLSALDLAPKLAERLIENGVDTIGKLEDLRAKCYDNYGEWPKGIGKAKVTVIEDALLDWLTANRDKAVFGELESEHAGEVADGDADEATDDGQAAGHESAEAGDDQVTTRAAELAAAESLESQFAEDIWSEGWEAFEAGKQLADNDRRPSQAQDDWIRGWLAAKAAGVTPQVPGTVEATETTEAAEVEQADVEQPAAPIPSKPQPQLVSMDDL